MINERGFSFLEGMLSFSFIVLVVLTLLPLMFRILINLDDGKKEMTAYRILYEYVEQSILSGEMNNAERSIRGVQYTLSFEGRWKACVEFENEKKCVGESSGIYLD